MSKDLKVIEIFQVLKKNGFTPLMVFDEAKKKGYKNFECLHILTIVFGMSLDEARKISYEYNKIDFN